MLHDLSLMPSMSLDVAQKQTSVEEREELACKLLESLPRSRLVAIQKRIAPLLQFDVIGWLPTEVALQIFSLLTAQSLLTCGLVSRRWHTLANDQDLWLRLCREHGWKWRQPSRRHPFDPPLADLGHAEDYDDEGMGDSDEDGDAEILSKDAAVVKAELSLVQTELDSGFISMTLAEPPQLESQLSSDSGLGMAPPTTYVGNQTHHRKPQLRHSAPASLKTFGPSAHLKPDYRLLYQTHMKLRNRFLHGSYRLWALQARGTPTDAHTSTIYCLQLYTYPSGVQVLFTGSRDRTVKEWNLETGSVERVINDVHTGSVLSICVHNGYLVSAGSDRKVVIWNLEKNELFGILSDHTDSVLSVRLDDDRLVSCSKDNLVKTYSFPSLTLEFVLRGHRAAVNAIALSKTHIVSGSGDRSVKVWDAQTGRLLRTFENHHSRGIASIDFRPPFILTGSSDKHLRLIDVTTSQGWSTSPDYHFADDSIPRRLPPVISNSTLENDSRLMCQVCGSENVHAVPAGVHGPCVHSDLVRSVALGEDYVVSGSYDLSIKIWDRRIGAMVADLKGGHTARIFCVTFDYTKIVSCGEDQRICVWDFSHGIDTSFLHRS